MKPLSILGKAVGAIAVLTVISGLVQMARPAWVLGIVGAQAGPTPEHFFGIVGMFMALFGGLALHGLRLDSAPPMLWSGLQKVGAVAAVGLGVRHDIFSGMALLVAGFDLLSAVLILCYWRVLASQAS